MEKIECVRVLEFDSGHRVVGHEGKCAKLHGHRYKCEVSCQARSLDALGRVIDFGIIKEKLGKWLDENWDHNVILNKEDEILGNFISRQLEQNVYFMDSNPTAENMAHYLLNNVCPKLFEGTLVQCTKIKLWETPNCFVEVSKTF